jgi:hypothetical protein
LRNTHIEYIPEVTEDSPDYNTNTERDILDSKIHAPETINDPTYPVLELAASPYEGNGASPLSDGRPPLIRGADAPEEKQRG